MAGLALPVFFAIILSWNWAVNVWTGEPSNRQKPSHALEPQHLIRRKRDRYPLTVNDSQLEKALATGDYELVQKFWGGGYLYSDGPGETYVPPGYQIKNGHELGDERLGR
jgi:hypothetical protein